VTPENKGQHILEEVERLEAVAKDSNLTMRLANRAGAFADYQLAGGHPYDGWRLQYWKEVGSCRGASSVAPCFGFKAAMHCVATSTCSSKLNTRLDGQAIG
jgi:hypothetical protein